MKRPSDEQPLGLNYLFVTGNGDLPKIKELLNLNVNKETSQAEGTLDKAQAAELIFGLRNPGFSIFFSLR